MPPEAPSRPKQEVRSYSRQRQAQASIHRRRAAKKPCKGKREEGRLNSSGVLAQDRRGQGRAPKAGAREWGTTWEEGATVGEESRMAVYLGSLVPTVLRLLLGSRVARSIPVPALIAELRLFGLFSSFGEEAAHGPSPLAATQPSPASVSTSSRPNEPRPAPPAAFNTRFRLLPPLSPRATAALRGWLIRDQ